jgi:flavin-dependent dehydrogenase
LGVATLDMGEGIGPSIRSGINAADAIIHGSTYSMHGLNRYSFPDLFGWRH